MLDFKVKKGYAVIVTGGEKNAMDYFKKNNGIAIKQVSTEGGKYGIYKILINERRKQNESKRD